MKRIQVYLEQDTYERLKTRAASRGLSISALIREIIGDRFKQPKVKRRRIEDFTFIASGGSEQEDLAPVSENHDEAFSRAILGRKRFQAGA